jgi:glycosyltransferase involved in cell wall biosynthesis
MRGRHDRDMDTSPDAGILVDLWPAARRSLRVAMVTETWPPEVNGVALTVARLVAGLREGNHTVQLVRPRQAAEGAPAGTDLHEVLLRGLPIPRYPQLKMGLPSKRRLVRLWSLQRPDVVHIATEGPLGWSALQAARVLKLPVVSDFRTNFQAYSRHYGIGWLRQPIVAYLRKFHNLTQATMVPTDALRRELAAAGFQNLRVVARGVDVAQFSPLRRSDALRASWGVGPGDRVLCCVGRLAPEKNLGLLLEAWRAMIQHDPRLKLVLVGDGPARAALQEAAPGIHFAGQRAGDDLTAHYASADFFAFPSLTETFGNVVPEAMASGLAVLACDAAAAGQLIRDGVNGLLAPVDDPRAFVSAAVRLAADPALGPRLGRQAVVDAAGWGWSHVVGRVEAEYLQAINAAALPLALPRLRSDPVTG